MPESEVKTRYTASTLLERLEWVLEKRYAQAMNQVAATELGLYRAAMRIMTDKELPDLPKYEDTLKHGADADGVALPSWQVRFIQANQGTLGQKWLVDLDKDDA